MAVSWTKINADPGRHDKKDNLAEKSFNNSIAEPASVEREFVASSWRRAGMTVPTGLPRGKKRSGDALSAVEVEWGVNRAVRCPEQSVSHVVHLIVSSREVDGG